MDSQQIEIIGRNILVAQLLQAGIEVAMPLRDRGVDLLCYREIDEQSGIFRALPIQLKAASRRSFGIHRKYERINDLLIAYVWNLGVDEEEEVYALTQLEAVAIGDAMGWTATESWRKGQYTTTRPSRKLLTLLEPYAMDRDAWRDRLELGHNLIDDGRSVAE